MKVWLHLTNVKNDSKTNNNKTNSNKINNNNNNKFIFKTQQVHNSNIYI